MNRSENMSRIKSKDTSIEIMLRKALWNRGIRYRKNYKDVFGKPDICFKGKKIAVFCDSEFWHGRYYLEGKYIPKTNIGYWVKKLEKNITRDKKVNEKLISDGWIVLRFWESDIKKDIVQVILTIEEALNSRQKI